VAVVSWVLAFGCFSQYEAANFRRAIDANAFVARKAATDMHDRLIDHECSRSIQDAVLTGRDDRTDQRERNLSAVVVASKN